MQCAAWTSRSRLRRRTTKKPKGCSKRSVSPSVIKLAATNFQETTAMAKTCMIMREKKRTKTVKKYAAKRKELKAVVLSPKASYEEKAAAQAKLQKLPRDASPSRQRNRCELTGRS